MFCHNCGTTVDPNAQHCPACGIALNAAPTPVAPPPLPPPAQAFGGAPGSGGPVQTGKWISEGWEIVKTELPMFALLTLIVAAVGSAVPVVLQGAMAIGFHIAIIKKMRTGTLDLGDCFKGFDFFVPALVASILIAVIVTVGAIFCIVPGLILGVMYKFSYLFILDKRLDFWPAMQASFDLTKRDLGGFLLFGLALVGINLVGALLCGIGLFVTVPISVVAITAAYRDLVGFEPTTAAV